MAFEKRSAEELEILLFLLLAYVQQKSLSIGIVRSRWLSHPLQPGWQIVKHVSITTPGTMGASGALARIAAALALVLLTLNPSGNSYWHWVARDFPHLSALRVIPMGRCSWLSAGPNSAPATLVLFEA